MNDDLNEEQRRQLYGSLLRGIGKEAQNRMCAADKSHDWSPWQRTALEHDIPLRPVSLHETTTAMNEVVRVKSERHCYNCGKKQLA